VYTRNFAGVSCDEPNLKRCVAVELGRVQNYVYNVMYDSKNSDRRVGADTARAGTQSDGD